MASGRKIGSTWLIITGILISLLGGVHLAMTPLVYGGQGWDRLPQEEARPLLYFYVATGLALLFAGTLTIRCARELRHGGKGAYGFAHLTAWFVLLLGVGAVVNMKSNPFAYVAAVVAVLNFVPIVGYRRAFRG